MDIKMTFYAIMVIYNKNYSESPAYETLSKLDFLKLIVVDNSTKDYKNNLIKNAKYIGLGENKGLAFAYNLALNEIKDYNSYVCIFDDDTSIPDDFFIKLKAKINKSDADILLPVVRDNKGIMSPCNIKKLTTKRVDNIKELRSDFVGINSGMCVKAEIFKNYRYNEKFFLDCIDFDFLKEMKKQKKKISLFKAELNQSFSSEVSSKENAKIRFRIFKNDYKLYSKGHPINYFYTLLRRRIKLVLQYKDISFLII